MSQVKIDNSVYSVFSNYTRADVNNIMNSLSFEDYSFLSFFPFERVHTYEDELRYENLIKFIQEKLNNKQKVIRHGRKARNIFETFSAYSEEKIWDAFSRLREDQQELIKLGYGEKLDDASRRNDLEISERRKLDSIVHNCFIRLLEKPEAKAQKIKTVFDFFPNNSHEEVWEAFYQLSDYNQQRIMRAYGEDLISVDKRKTVDSAELKCVFSLIDYQLRKLLQPVKHIAAKNIFEYFEGYSKEDIMEAFSTLSSSQQELLKRAYGENLDDASKRLELTPKERTKANDIIRSTFKNRVDSNLAKTHYIKNIFERLNEYTPEEIWEAFSRFSEEQQALLKKAYGENLDDGSNYSLLSEDEKRKVNGLISHSFIVRLSKKQCVSTSLQTLFEIYSEYSYEELMDAISRLRVEDQELLKKAYGEDYTNPQLKLTLPNHEKVSVNSIVYGTLSRRLRNPKLAARKIITIFEQYSEFSREEIWEAFHKLIPTQQELLKSILGEDLEDLSGIKTLNKTNRAKFFRIIDISLDKKLHAKHKQLGRIVKNVFERHPEYEEKEILLAVSRLSDEDQELLRKAYGEDLRAKDCYSLLTKKEKYKVRNIVAFSISNRLNNQVLKGKKRVSRFQSFFGFFTDYSHEEIMESFLRIPKEDQEFLKGIYGEDLQQECSYTNLDITVKKRIDSVMRSKLLIRLKDSSIGKYRVKKFFDYFEDFTKEEVLKAFHDLSKEDQDLLKIGYGENLDEVSGYHSLSQQERHKIHRIISKKMKRILKPDLKKKSVTNPFKHFSNYSEEEVWNAFYRLPKDKQELLKKAYGEDLRDIEGYYLLSPAEKKQVSSILKQDFIKRLQNPELKGYGRGRTVKSVVERFPDYSFEEIQSAVGKLTSKRQLLLTKAFGPHLDSHLLYKQLSANEKTNVQRAIAQLQAKLQTSSYEKSEKEEPDQSFVERKKQLDKKSKEDALLSREREKRIIKKSLLSYYPNASKEDRKRYFQYYCEVTPRFSRLYEKADTRQKNQLLEDAIENSKMSRENFFAKKEWLLVKLARKNGLPKELSHIGITGLDAALLNYSITSDECFADYAESFIDYYFQEYSKSHVKTSNEEKPAVKRRHSAKSLCEYFSNYTYEQIREVTCLLSNEEQELLKKTYGESYDSVDGFYQLSEEEKKALISLRQKIRRRLDPKNPTKTVHQEHYLPEILGVDIEKIQELFAYLPNDSQDLLKKAYGDSLTETQKYSFLSTSEKNKVYRIRTRLQKVIKGERNKEWLTYSYRKKVVPLTEYFKDFSHEVLVTAIGQLTKEEQQLLRKAYGEHLDSTKGYYILDEEDKKKVALVRKRIQRHLESRPNRRSIREHSLLEYLGEKDVEKVYEFVSLLPESQQKLLRKAYGNSLMQVDCYETLSDEEKKREYKARYRLRAALRGKRVLRRESKQVASIKKTNQANSSSQKTVSVSEKNSIPFRFSFGDTSSDSVLKAITQLEEEDRNLLIKAYGEQFDAIGGESKLSLEEEQKISQIRQKIRKILIAESRKSISTVGTKGGRRPVSILQCFHDTDREKFWNAFNSLSFSEQSLLKRAYGEQLDNSDGFYLLSSKDKIRINNIRNKMKKILGIRKSTSKSRTNTPKKANAQKSERNTNIYDLPYKELSRREEIDWAKKAKLSYYYDVSEEEKQKYLDYYFEVFPIRRKRYYKLLSEISHLVHYMRDESFFAAHCENGLEEQRKETIEELKKVSVQLKKLEKKRKILLEGYIDDSREYRDKFLANNQRLVASIAYRKKGQHSYDDLISEGNIGMMIAFEKFDVEAGIKFSTYATWWIRQKIDRYIMDKEKTIRIPVYIGAKSNKLRMAFESLRSKLLREPTLEELSAETGYDVKEIQQIREYQKISEPASIDKTIRNDKSEENTEFANFIGEEDPNYKQVEENVFFEQLMALMEKTNLTEQEIIVLKQRLGLEDNIIHTLDEIGQDYGVTREGIRQIEKKALHKLRTFGASKRFFSDFRL